MVHGDNNNSSSSDDWLPVQLLSSRSADVEYLGALIEIETTSGAIVRGRLSRVDPVSNAVSVLHAEVDGHAATAPCGFDRHSTANRACSGGGDECATTSSHNHFSHAPRHPSISKAGLLNLCVVSSSQQVKTAVVDPSVARRPYWMELKAWGMARTPWTSQSPAFNLQAVPPNVPQRPGRALPSPPPPVGFVPMPTFSSKGTTGRAEDGKMDGFASSVPRWGASTGGQGQDEHRRPQMEALQHVQWEAGEAPPPAFSPRSAVPRRYPPRARATIDDSHDVHHDARRKRFESFSSFPRDAAEREVRWSPAGPSPLPPPPPPPPSPPLNRGVPIYWAVDLDAPSTRAVLGTPIMKYLTSPPFCLELKNEFHCTLAYLAAGDQQQDDADAALRPLVGRRVRLTIGGVVATTRVACAAAIIDDADVARRCRNTFPHLTLALAPNARAVESNDVLAEVARGQLRFQWHLRLQVSGTVRAH